MKLNVALVGCGKVADQHVSEIKKLRNADLVAVCDTELLMAEQLAGRYDIPAYYSDFDGMLAIAKLLELLATFQMRLSEVVDDLPTYYVSSTQVTCPWENKGKVMRILSEQYRERRSKPIDGIKIDLGKEWVLVLPDADRPLFHVFAESVS